MAKLKGNIDGPVSGRIRNVVFYERYGNTYVRAAPVTNENTWNDEQKMLRQRISTVSAFWRGLKSVQFSRIWNTAAQKMNGYAWFVKANMPALQRDGSLIDAGLIKISDGSLPVPQKLIAERVEGEPALMNVSWQNDPHSGKERLNDEMMMISFVNQQFSPIIASGLKRSQLGGTFALPLKPAGPTHVFLFMASADKEKYSESLCYPV